MSKSGHDIVLKRLPVRREIRLFIASPSDCLQERKIIRDIVDEMNEVFCRSLQVALVPIGWENVAPNLGEPQAVIDDAIKQYDILVGTMWLRFGTPTADGAQSGTEHEFNQAYELWKNTGTPLVMFYFNDQPPESMRSLDIEQYGKVRSFREKIEKLALVKSYISLDEFERFIRLDLQRVVHDISTKTVPGVLAAEPIPDVISRQESEILPPLFFHSCALPRHFIRRQEILRLVEIVESKEKAEIAPSLISVVGIGGSGKTVAVRAAIEELLKREIKLNAIFWYSFYEAKAQSAEEFLSEALNYLSQGRIDTQSYPSPHQRKVLLWKYLEMAQCILVLDGLEYLQFYDPAAKSHGQLQDRVIKDFLRGACQLKSSVVIVTSRLYLADLYGYHGYHNISLGAFRKEEAWSFMRDSGVIGSDQEVDDACSIFGYHPLSLRVLTDYLVRFYAGTATAAERFRNLPSGSPVAEKLDVLFDSYWKFLNADQQFFLSRLSALRTGATEKDFSVLVRPKEMGGSGDPEDLSFRQSLMRLEETALLEVHVRGDDKFYTAPALLRMLAYDRMSKEDRKKAHLEWLRYTEGIPVPSAQRSVEEFTPVIEMIYHCLMAGLYARAWELYNRRGKYNLSRHLIDWGSHEVAIEIGREFWRLKHSVATAVPNSGDFINELIGFYATHLALSGRIATALKVISDAPSDEFGMPLCIRTRYYLITGDYESARQTHRSSMLSQHSQYSVEWSNALLKFYSSDDPECIYHFETALERGFMLVRGYLGLLYFDYITALISFGRIPQAKLETIKMESYVIKDGDASGLDPYVTFLNAELSRANKHINQAEQQYKHALIRSKELGDTFLECVVLLGHARLELEKFQQDSDINFIDTAVELCHKSLTLCREAGEGELEYGFMVCAGEIYTILTHASLIRGDSHAAYDFFTALTSILNTSQSYRLMLEYQVLEAKFR